MSFLSGVSDFIGGSLFKEVKEGVMAYFPPDVSPTEKLAFELKLQEVLADKEKEANKVLSEASTALDKRIAEQEGTAKDLLSMPYLGRLVLFLRGLQRPVWGFFVMYIDYVWFTGPSSKIIDGQTIATFTEQQQTALIVINILVLGFLFGERTIKNLTPLIIKVFGNSGKQNNS